MFDASVLVKLFVPEPDSALAQQVAARFRLVLTPDLARLEVASAITRAARRGGLSPTHAQQLLTDWRRFVTLGNVRLTPLEQLQPRAEHWSLALSHPLADCVYLALAEETTAPLLTADQPFADKAKTVYAAVRHLSAFVI